MAYINAASSGNSARLLLNVNDGTAPALVDFLTTGTGSPVLHTVDAGVLDTPAIQDISIVANAGTFRWKQLDSLSEQVVTTVSTNSITGNLVIDPTSFFGDGAGDVTAVDKGIFTLSNNKVKVDFLIALDGITAGDRVIFGSGYITNLNLQVSADNPVWTSPYTLEVDGSYTQVVLGSTIA